MEIHKLFFFMRKARGITQQELADKIGVSQSAVARLERGETTAISKQSLQDIAPQLNINPRFLSAEDENPFLMTPDEFVFYRISTGFSKMNITPITWCIENCDICDVYALSPPVGVPCRLIRGARKDELTYAVLMRDRFGNIFLFRHITNFVFLFYSKKAYYESLQSVNRNIDYQFKRIDINLHNLLNQETITSHELRTLFVEDIYPLTLPEQRLIRVSRQREINIETLIENIERDDDVITPRPRP